MNQLLEKLNKLSIKLSLKGDNLDIQGPKGSITPSILEEIKNHKNEIVSFLTNISSKTTISKSEERENYPLSSTQKRMWLLYQMNPENVAYHIPMMFEIEGNLNIDKLQKTFGYLVEKHESFRTIFQEDNLGNPIQIIKEFSEDLFQLSFTDSNIQENIQNEINTPFDLTKDVLLRGTVFKTADNKYLLLIVMHHIISDGWSIEVLAKDFFEAYKNVDNKDFNFEDLKIQYKDYAIWQQEKLKTQNSDKEYWLSTFNGEIPILELPLYKTRPKHKSGKGNTISAQLGAQELSLFQKLCFDNGATLFMGIKSLVDILLFKYSHQNEIIVGTPIANREYPELQDQIGFYANTLALKTNIDSSRSFLNLLNNNKSQLLEVYKHQEYPFDELVSNLKLPHDPSRNPLFDVMVSLQEKSEDIASQLENLTIKKLIPEDHTSKFDLTFNFYVEDNQLNLELTYDTEIYDEKFARGLIEHLSNLLNNVVENEKSLIKDIDIITSEERHQLLVEFNDTKVDYPSDKTIIELFEEQVEKTPENVAVVFEDTELTYRELNEQANQLGDYLRQNYHIEPDDLVAIKLERSEKMIVAILGTLKSGAAYVPIDPEYPEKRIDYIEQDTQAKVTIDTTFLESYQEELKKEERQYKKDNLPIISRPDSLAYVIYTSGTTGQPKGVMIENKSVVNYILFQKQFLDFNDEKVALLTTYTFDASVEQIFLSLLNKSVLCIISKTSINEREILQSILNERSITHVHSVPSLLTNLDLQNLPSLKRIISAGEKYNKNLSDKYINNYRLYNKYGPTESTISILIKEIQTKNEVSLGVPISNTQVYILDEDLRVVPVGVSGTLYVSGIGLSRGYLNKPELTAEKFIDNPFEEGTKMYDTGDLARWLPDGNIEFLGRKDFQVKIRGYRIELGEIETNISQFSFGIKQVVGEAKEVNGEKVLVAYYTKDEDTIIDKTELREYLQSKLPEYMVPGFFVELESIPLTPNGKIDRKALPSVSGEDLIRREYVAPKNATEEKLAEIWQEVLGVEKVGITDNFFELGGHSLMVAQVLNRIHQNLSMQVSFKDFFASPSIEGIAKSLTGKEYTPIPKVPEQESYPLTPSQQRLWVLSQLEGGSQAYNMPAVVTLRGELNEVCFEKSFQSLIGRHEILRTSFKSDKATGEIRQYITPKEEVHFTIEVLDYVGRHESEVEDYLQSANNEAFNLEESPLIRATLLRRDNKEHLFFLSMHHIIGDGWSTEVLVSEVVENYNNLLDGNTNEDEILKEELAIQYKDYAVWLQEEIKEEKYRKAEFYWLEQFEGELPVLELPSYKTRPLIQTYNGNNISHLFSKEFTEKLKQYSEQHGATLFMTLMAGVKALLYRYTGQQDIIVGTPIAGREHPDLENQIGLYLNTLAIRTRLEEDHNTFESLLKKEKETLLSAYEHQLYPFDELVGKLNIKRDTSRSALFDVLVVFQNQGQLQIGNAQNNIEGLQVEEYDYHRKTSQFDVSYTFAEEGKQLGLTIEYNTDIYDEFLIQRMFAHFENLLTQAIEHTEDKTGTTAIESIDFLTEQERHELLVEFNDTKVDYPSDKTIIELFEEQVEKTPDNVAVVFEDTELTYRELNEQANELGDYLRQNYHIQPDDLVTIKLERSEKMIVVILGILKSGAAYVPIDPEYPQERIEYIEHDTQAKISIDKAFLESYQEELKRQGSQYTRENLPIISRPDSLAYVIYTSGTTGQPKGVMMENHCLYNLIKDHQRMKINHDKVSQFTSISFDVSFQELFFPLTRGGELHLLNEVTRLSSDLFSTYIKENQLSTIFLPTSYFKFLASEINEKFSGISCLTDIVVAGEQLVLSASIITFLKNNRVQLHNHYGPAETHVVTTYTQSAELNNLHYHISPIGKPIANTSIYILNENNHVQASHVFGFLYIGGEAVSRGYLNRQDLTMERFVPDLMDKTKQMYKTGDIARWLPDGNLEYFGRKDEQIKIRGYRIELGELEQVLSTINGVEQVAVLALTVSGTEKELVAFLSLKKDITKKQIRESLQKRVPVYMIPSYFTVLEELPLNKNGKVDRKKLMEYIDLSSQTDEQYKSATTETEHSLKEIWESVLNIQDLSVTSNFFEIGGHSLKGILLINRIYEKLNVKIDLQDVFNYFTIESMAKLIESKETDKYHAIPLATIKSGYVLSHSQERMWILNQIAGYESAYNFSSIFVLNGLLDIAALKNAFDHVIKKYEILRTTFDYVDNRPVQLINSFEEIAFRITEYTIEAEKNKEKKLDELYMKCALTPFNLKKGPMIRVDLIRQSKDKFYLIITTHYIIYDGWSINIILKELITQYNGFYQHVPVKDEPLRIQYKDYSEWQQHQLTNLKINDARDFWLDQFQGQLPSLNFPADRERPEEISYDGDFYEVLIDKNVTAKLNKLCRENKTTPFNVLLSAVNVLLNKYTGQTDIVLGTTVSGRGHIDTENQIGSFVNTLGLRTIFKTTDSFRTMLTETSKKVSKAFKYGDYPFDLLVDELKLERDLRRSPLFDMMVLFHNIDKEKEAALVMNGVKVSIPEKKQHVSKFDISFIFYEQEDEIRFQLEYSTLLFERETIVLLSNHFVELIKHIVEFPDTKINDFPIMNDEVSQPEIFTIKKAIQYDDLERAIDDSIALCKKFKLMNIKEFQWTLQNITAVENQKIFIKQELSKTVSKKRENEVEVKAYLLDEETTTIILSVPATNGYRKEDVFINLLWQQLSSYNNLSADFPKFNKDFMNWQRDVFFRENIRRHKGYWQEMKSDLLILKEERNKNNFDEATSKFGVFDFHVNEDRSQLREAELIVICSLFQHYQLGQTMMAVRSLSLVNKKNNFKESRLIINQVNENDSIESFRRMVEKNYSKAGMFQLYPYERIKKDVNLNSISDVFNAADIVISFNTENVELEQFSKSFTNSNIMYQFVRNLDDQLLVRIHYNEQLFSQSMIMDFKKFMKEFLETNRNEINQHEVKTLFSFLKERI